VDTDKAGVLADKLMEQARASHDKLVQCKSMQRSLKPADLSTDKPSSKQRLISRWMTCSLQSGAAPGGGRCRSRWSAQELILSAPPDVGTAQLRDFVSEKRFWIYTKLAEKDRLQRPVPRKEFVGGEGFLYLGRTHRLKLVESRNLGWQMAALLCAMTCRLGHGSISSAGIAKEPASGCLAVWLTTSHVWRSHLQV
jgi:hypothetical protein